MGRRKVKTELDIYIEEKEEVLTDLGIFSIITKDEFERLENAKSEISVDNIARSLINKYLSN